MTAVTLLLLVRYMSVHLRPGYMKKGLVAAVRVRTKLNAGVLYTQLSDALFLYRGPEVDNSIDPL